MSSVAEQSLQQRISPTFLLAILTGAGSLTFTSVLMVGPLLVDLATEFDTTVAVVGQLVAAGALVWAGLAPLCGMLSDRLGRKVPMLVGLITLGACVFLSGSAADLPSLFVARMLTSVGGPLVVTNIQTSIADYFPAEQRGRALGWSLTGGSLAPVVGVPLLAFVAQTSGWRWSFRLLGLLLLLVAVIIWRCLPRTRATGGRSYRATFTSLRNRSVAGLLTSNTFERIMWSAIGTYLAAFLMQSYGLSVGEVAPIISLVAVGTLTGNFLGGRIAGRLDPVAIFILTQIAAGLLALPLMFFPSLVWLSATLAAAFSISNSLNRPSFMLMVTEVAPNVRGAMIGLNVMTNQLGIVLGAAAGGLAIALGDYGGLGILGCTMGALAALSCRLLVKPSQLATVGAETGGVKGS